MKKRENTELQNKNIRRTKEKERETQNKNT